MPTGISISLFISPVFSFEPTMIIEYLSTVPSPFTLYTTYTSLPAASLTILVILIVSTSRKAAPGVAGSTISHVSLSDSLSATQKQSFQPSCGTSITSGPHQSIDVVPDVKNGRIIWRER
ncbi:hypothetical protein DFH29DRAFT_366210 [Suillus ampliporus]|nr:hypothetical protein DFH29DRAFT_366210 [Suillus ampliporus]